MADDDDRGAGDERRAKMISHRKRATERKSVKEKRERRIGSDVVGLDQEDVLNLGGGLPKEEAVGGRELSRFVVFLVFLVFLFFSGHAVTVVFCLRNHASLFILFYGPENPFFTVTIILLSVLYYY